MVWNVTVWFEKLPSGHRVSHRVFNLTKWSDTFFPTSPRVGCSGAENMNNRLIAVLAAVLVASLGTSAFFAMTWTDSRITMNAATSSVVALGLFSDCAATIPFTTHNWDGVVEGQEYEVAVYVRNIGTEAVYITYTPGSLSFDGAQTRFRINVSVLEGPALPCQLLPITPTLLPVKNPLVCERGFLLLPGKVIKLDIILLVDSVVSGGSWSWSLFIAGCAP